MSVKNLRDLVGFYDSYEVDIDEDFYIPLFKHAKRVDRVSCYFSSKALALYSKGLEEFTKHPDTKYRLIISEEISFEDFESIKKGELAFESYDDLLISRLRETLTLDEENSVGMLVDLISAGVVEVKIAFVRKGLFHSKWAYVEGLENESMLMLGSNNETASAIEENYEEFDFRECIPKDNHKKKFEDLWNNKKDGVITQNPSKLLWSELKNYSKSINKKIDEEDLGSYDDCIILDLKDGQICLINRLETTPSNYSIVYKSRIKNFTSSFNPGIKFKSDLNYVDFSRIINNMEIYCKDNDFELIVSRKLSKYVDEHNLLLEKRKQLGLDIKNKNLNIRAQFEEYRETIDAVMSRQLYDQQAWDSFFMYSMKKAGNFSVPGSGKTASVLGVYAFLRVKEDFKRLIVICPLNSFDSWISEYKSSFGNAPIVFDSREHGGSHAIPTLLNQYSTTDLILINYQSLHKYAEVIDEQLVNKGLLVFDEGHYIKGWETQRTSAAKIASHNASRTLILTGTPMPNTYADLYSLLNILFPREYPTYFGYDLATLRKPSEFTIQSINEKIQPFYCRTSKKDLQIPEPNVDQDIFCYPSDDEIKLYEMVKERCNSSPFSLIIRMLQAESDPRMLLSTEISENIVKIFNEEMTDDNYDSYEYNEEVLEPSLIELESFITKIDLTTKTKKCIQLTKQIYEEGKTLIIWCIFRKSIENISNLLNNCGIKCKTIDGTVDPRTRSKIIEEFRNGDFKVLVTNPHTLAESVSLHDVCHDTIYFEYSYNLVHLLQSKDRIHRLGLKKGQYTQHRFMKVFSSKSNFNKDVSLDEEIHNRLKYKENLMNEAIEKGVINITGCSPKEDVIEIFRKMGWYLPNSNM